MKKIVLVGLCLAILALTTLSAAQDKPRLSPAASASCKFADGKTIKMDYSSPRIFDPKTHAVRKIFGSASEKALVPFGEVWRTGANEATTFVVDTDVIVGNLTVPKGSYTIFTIPKADAWTLILSKKTGEWGTEYAQGDDLGRTTMTANQTANRTDNFTISLDGAGKKCSLRMEWENTRATVDINEK